MPYRDDEPPREDYDDSDGPGSDGTICEVDFDSAVYIGGDDDGCYVAIAEGGDGWYTSVVVDSDTGGFVEPMITDDGPFPTDGDAMQRGIDLALEWCFDNAVDTSCTVRISFNPGSDPARIADLLAKSDPMVWESSDDSDLALILTFPSDYHAMRLLETGGIKVAFTDIIGELRFVERNPDDGPMFENA